MDAKQRAAERRRKILAKQKDRLAIASGNSDHLGGETTAVPATTTVPTTPSVEVAAEQPAAKTPAQSVPADVSGLHSQQWTPQSLAEVTAPSAPAARARWEAQDYTAAGFPVQEPAEPGQSRNAVKAPSVPAWARISALAAIAAFFVLAWVPTEGNNVGSPVQAFVALEIVVSVPAVITVLQTKTRSPLTLLLALRKDIMLVYRDFIFFFFFLFLFLRLAPAAGLSHEFLRETSDVPQ